MRIRDHLTCLLRNLYPGQEATIRNGHGTTDWFQIRKGVCQGCILSPCLFNLYAEYIMRNAGLDEAQAGIKLVGRHTLTLWLIHVNVWQKPPLYCKVISLQLKLINFKKRLLGEISITSDMQIPPLWQKVKKN